MFATFKRIRKRDLLSRGLSSSIRLLMKPIKRQLNKLCLVSCIALSVLLSGCLGETDGIDPPSDELIYPVALSSVLDDSHLLVVNSNFWLEYNAGTLVAYSLSTLDAIGGQPTSYDTATGVLTLPAGVSFGQFCTGGRTGTYCNLDAAAGILANETIRLGAYASELNITPAGDRALIPVRGEQTIITVDIASGANLLDCGESDNDDKRCDDDHRITGNGQFGFPIEPYDVATMDYVHEENGVQVTDTLGFASHRAGGDVSLFSVSRQQAGESFPVADNSLLGVLNGVLKGASGIVANPQRQEVYLVGQRDDVSRVAVLEVQTDWRQGGSYLTDPSFGQTRSIDINGEIMYGTGARDIAVSPDGNTGFVITQNPPALLKLDLQRYRVSDMATVCRESAKVETFVDEQDPDDPLDDKLYAYILCFTSGQVYIVDADYMVPVIRKTGSGPQDITFDSRRKIAYIANFTESTITMIQSVAPFNLIRVVEAGSAAAPLILRIGKP